jgi:hypothetical protein
MAGYIALGELGFSKVIAIILQLYDSDYVYFDFQRIAESSLRSCGRRSADRHC